MSYLVFHRPEHGEAGVLERIKYPVPSFCVTASPKEYMEGFFGEGFCFFFFLNTS